MAIYHCSMKSVSRGAGQSIVAAAAYRHACKLENSQTGEVYDYSRKRGLEFSGIYLPSRINPSWAYDRNQLWNAAEAAEKRKNACLGREIVLALPDELSAENRRELTEEMARYLADRYGLVVDVAIHHPSHNGDQRNHHAHLLMSSRRITPEGFGEKARELDDIKVRGPVEVEQIRAEWARLANRALERAGQHVQIDHRSFQRRDIKRMPTLHLGPSASTLERRGMRTRLGDRNRAAQSLNAQVGELERECLATENGADRERSYAAWVEKTRQADPDSWEQTEKRLDVDGRRDEFDRVVIAAADEVRAAKRALDNHDVRVNRQNWFVRQWNSDENDAKRRELEERLDEANRHRDNASAQFKTREELAADAGRASEERRMAWESSAEWRDCEERCRNRTARVLDFVKTFDRQAAEARRAREERTRNRLVRRHLAPLLRTIAEKKQTQEQTHPRLVLQPSPAPDSHPEPEQRITTPPQPTPTLQKRTERAMAVAERFRLRSVSAAWGQNVTRDIPISELGPSETPPVFLENRTRESEQTPAAPALDAAESRRNRLRGEILADEQRLIDLKITANIALKMHNGDARALIDNTRAPVAQRNYYIEKMNAVDLIDKKCNVVAENAILDEMLVSNNVDWYKKQIENFCAVKIYTGDRVCFHELGISGVCETLQKYSHVVEHLETERKREQQQRQREIEQERERQARAAAEAKRQAERERRRERGGWER